MARNKYRVAPPEQRHWNGKTYDSKAEMRRAVELHALLDVGHFAEIVEQPKLSLGVRENVYRPDFLLIPVDGHPYYEDVKGQETAKFKRDKKLWRRYGRLPLHVVMSRGSRFETVEVVEGGGGQHE